MEKDHVSSTHQAPSQPPAIGLTPDTSPICQSSADGQSVGSAPSPTLPRRHHDNTPRWYVIRATHGRAQHVYDQIIGLNNISFEVYIPRYHHETLKIEDGQPTKVVTEGLLHNGLVFLRTTRTEFYKLVHASDPYPQIKGLTPYYNHFHEQEAGRNDYLVVPDKQFLDFRTILESEDDNILIDQESMPSYLNGKKVEVTNGPFAGVTGTLLRWKGLRRVFIKLDQLGTFATGFVRNCDFRLIE